MRAKGICSMHYNRKAKFGTVGPAEPVRVKDRPCAVEGCGGLAVSNRLCGKHVSRMRRTGSTADPEVSSDWDRFWSHVRKAGPDDCWEWTAPTSKGYGRFFAPNFEGRRARQVGAHRWIFVMLNGPMPASMFVCHRCDNPPCVNPAHLFAGSAADNAADMMNKGRHARAGAPRGSRHGQAKLTEEAVAAIRSEWTGERGQQTAMARRYGVAPSTIYGVIQGTTWRP